MEERITRYCICGVVLQPMEHKVCDLCQEKINEFKINRFGAQFPGYVSKREQEQVRCTNKKTIKER